MDKMMELPEAMPVLSDTAFGRTVRALRKICLEAAEGAFLGSEPELQQRLSVSRPTLRQAAKVLENDHLLSVRRGLNGGFFAMRPDTNHAVKSPALYLRLHDATLDQMNRASMLLMPEAAASAAECADSALIEEMQQFRDGIETRSETHEDYRSLLRAEFRMVRLILQMSGDPVLTLFMEISYSFGQLEREFTFYRRSEERRQRWRDLQKIFCDAILSGDPEIARLMSQRRGKLIADWIQEDRFAAESLL